VTEASGRLVVSVAAGKLASAIAGREERQRCVAVRLSEIIGIGDAPGPILAVGAERFDDKRAVAPIAAIQQRDAAGERRAGIWLLAHSELQAGSSAFKAVANVTGHDGKP
jgi:hypothetical protein